MPFKPVVVCSRITLFKLMMICLGVGVVIQKMEAKPKINFPHIAGNTPFG